MHPGLGCHFDQVDVKEEDGGPNSLTQIATCGVRMTKSGGHHDDHYILKRYIRLPERQIHVVVEIDVSVWSESRGRTPRSPHIDLTHVVTNLLGDSPRPEVATTIS